MQGICRLSRRWHQQFCQSPSFGPHQRCLQALTPCREYRQVSRSGRKTRREALQSVPRFNHPDHLNDVNSISALKQPIRDGDEDNSPFSPSRLLLRDDDDLVVREFEQYGSDESTRRDIEPGKELRDEAEVIWAELQDIDRQLEIAKQGPFGPQSEFMKQFPKEKREQILQALTKEGFVPEDEEDALDLAEIDKMMEEEDTPEADDLAVTLHIPKAHHALVTHFNKALKEARDHEEDTLKTLNLWKWYLRCQQRIPGFSQIVSEGVWEFLWQSQSRLGARKRHLVMLGRDITAAGGGMTDNQCLEYVQALDACGDSITALTTWEEARGQLQRNLTASFLADFYATGIRLYASVGRPQKAENVAIGAIKEGVDPKIFEHVIAAWVMTKTPSSSTKAWAAYLRMRSMLGEDMRPEMYETISDLLLDNQRSEMALAVFKDMISRVKGSGVNTLRSYTQALGNIDINADPEKVEEAINQVSLTMLLTLPKQYQNKFFFASWIKKLLGQQRTDSASQVVDLMYERNIRPDAIHLNGIIGAWLRDKSPRARERAEKLALEMIQARINQVSQWSQNLSLQELGNVFRKTMPVKESQNPWKNPIHLERPVPAANIETFSLLFDYNEERHKWQEFSRLTEIMMGPAQLRPNSFIINKWLAAELQARSFDRFWALFNGFRHRITPDIETYGLAWQAVTSQQTTSSGKSSFSHRQLFADMMEWTRQLDGRQLRLAQEGFETGFYTQVVRSFSYQLDLPGTICALQGMYDAFGATPNDVSVRLITGQGARLLPRTGPESRMSGGRRRASAKFAPDQTTLKGIADIASTLEMKHKIDLVETQQATAEEVEDVDSAVSHKIRLDVMIEFLMIIMQKTRKSTDNPTKTLRDVSKVMHVGIERINLDSIMS